MPAGTMESRVAVHCDDRRDGRQPDGGPWPRWHVERISEHVVRCRCPVARSIRLRPSRGRRSGGEALVSGGRDSNAGARCGDRRWKRIRRPRQPASPAGAARAAAAWGVRAAGDGGTPSERRPASLLRVDPMADRAVPGHGACIARRHQAHPGFKTLAAPSGSMPNAPGRADPGRMPRRDRLRRLADWRSRAMQRRRGA